MSSDLLDVSVTTRYIDDQSAPDRDSYVFTYSVIIKNKGQVGAQLIARHWIITDANNHVEEIRGLGVVGRQPLLKPGDSTGIDAGRVFVCNGTGRTVQCGNSGIFAVFTKNTSLRRFSSTFLTGKECRARFIYL